VLQFLANIPESSIFRNNPKWNLPTKEKQNVASVSYNSEKKRDHWKWNIPQLVVVDEAFPHRTKGQNQQHPSK
jgi:hypothetical protein